MIDPVTKTECACPLNGKLCVDGSREDFPKNSIGGLVKCRWWQHLAGKDPQSEKSVDQFDCAVAWLPITTVETAQMNRQTGASVDKVANELAEVRQGIVAMGAAIRVAATGISQAVEHGALTVMLSGPTPDQGPNGHEHRELNEGEQPNEK